MAVGDLRKNISTHEIACKDGCGLVAITDEVLDMWQDARDHFSEMYHKELPLIIRSGCRCYPHNKNEGGAGKSEHLPKEQEDGTEKCNAIDGFIRGVPHFRLFNYFDSKYPNSHGFKLYNSFVHGDCRKQKWRA